MSHDPTSSPSSRILVVDDNPQILELIEAYLEPLGVAVSTAPDGQAALAAIESQPPDLVVLDIMMPRRSGYEVCRSMKEDPRFRDIPVIMVTALNEVGDMERARECGADDFLTKPVNKMELVARVQSLLQVRNLKRQGSE